MELYLFGRMALVKKKASLFYKRDFVRLVIELILAPTRLLRNA